MTTATIETVQSLLEEAIEQTDDPEVHFTLRQAAQLLLAVDERIDCHDDPPTRSNAMAKAQ